MTKSELRRQLLVDTASYMASGNQITTLQPQKHKVKSVCRGKSSNTVIKGGDVPTIKISSLYNSYEN
jgi:hypothetical protein